MVIIQPFEYEKTTAFKERVQIANKVNEIINLFNDLDIESKINIFNEEIEIINGKIAEIDSKIIEVNNAVDIVEGYNTRLTSVENESVSLDARLDNLEPRVTANETLSSNNKTRLDNITPRVTATENKNTEQDNRLNTIENGNLDIYGVKYFEYPIIGNTFGVSISRTLGYYKTFNLGTKPSDTTAWYVNVMFVWRYGISLIHAELGFTNGEITSLSTNRTNGSDAPLSGNTMLCFDVIDNNVYLVVHRVSQSNVYSRITVLDVQRGASSHPYIARLKEGEFYTPETTLIESELM